VAFAAAHKADPLLQEPIELSNRLIPVPERKASLQAKKRSSRQLKAGKARAKRKKRTRNKQ
jgi:hypothetical protein